ncbi:hypothetical protein Y1Q_0009328 [Alligator mississippiensis]|uniref:Uncharacterized protein n=1 Tax=Alligator mississippiensis TaxID=8496 RepID=A0A151N7I4_ALLMI|nr:hypothetical protein Y1Q_0009328 [Alligator mississippiensis]
MALGAVPNSAPSSLMKDASICARVSREAYQQGLILQRGKLGLDVGSSRPPKKLEMWGLTLAGEEMSQRYGPS